jgi:hypothetical protein
MIIKRGNDGNWEQTDTASGGVKFRVSWDTLDTLLARTDRLRANEEITQLEIDPEHGITVTVEKV